MADDITKQLDELIQQNAELLQRAEAQSVIINELRDMVEDLTNAVGNLSLPYGDGFEVN